MILVQGADLFRESIVLNVLQHPHPILDVVCKDAEPGHEAAQLLRDMFETCKAHGGLGLSAPQIGLPIRAVVVVGEVLADDPTKQMIWGMLNPRITRRSGIKETRLEGCLSLDYGKARVPVSRSISVTVEGIDDDGTPMKIEAKGLHAIAWQHELDHLQGRLITHYGHARTVVDHGDQTDRRLS